MKHWIVLMALVVSAPTFANSFVGNGGNVGDVELEVTWKQIEQIFDAIQDKAEEKPVLCQCNDMFEGREICQPLDDLTDQQRAYCTERLYAKADQIQKLITDRKNIRIRWTSEPITVKEGNSTRAADAVTISEKKEITINQPRFLGLRQSQRVFLLTHELMHLTKDNSGKYMSDLGPAGPFKSDEGSRQLINSMSAAAAVMQGAYPREIRTYSSALLRSQSWKPRWLTLNVGKTSTSKNADQRAIDGYNHVQLDFRYQLTNMFGLTALYRGESGEKKIFNTVEVTENVNSIGLGGAVRLFPFSDPLTFLGQSHLVLEAVAEMINADYKANDTYVNLNGSQKVWGGTLSANYYLPINYNIWLSVGGGLRYRSYEYSSIGVNPENQATFLQIGAAYAF